jgi:hypothetical protein
MSVFETLALIYLAIYASVKCDGVTRTAVDLKLESLPTRQIMTKIELRILHQKGLILEPEKSEITR